MKSFLLFSIHYLLITVFPVISYCQDTVPPDTVTIISVTGNTNLTITWTACTSPDLTGYFVYIYRSGYWINIGTVYAVSTRFVHLTSHPIYPCEASLHQECYRIAAFDTVSPPNVSEMCHQMCSINNSLICQHEKPVRYILFQNTPNPFRQITEITFYIPEKTFVDLNIYNVHGEKLETLISEEMPAGEHNIEFRQKDYKAGAYIYQLVTPVFTGTKLMNVLN